MAVTPIADYPTLKDRFRREEAQAEIARLREILPRKSNPEDCLTLAQTLELQAPYMGPVPTFYQEQTQGG
jgi:hypothetical protein